MLTERTKYFIERNAESKLGYDFVAIQNGIITERVELTRKTPDNYLYLPQVSIDVLHRTFIGLNLLAKVMVNGNDRYELTEKPYKEPRKLGQKEQPWQDFMTDEEKAIIAKIESDCKARREAAKPSAEQLEALKLQKQIAALQDKLAKLNAAE